MGLPCKPELQSRPMSLDSLRRDLQSGDLTLVANAITGLVKLAEGDARLQAEVLSVCQKWVEDAPESYVAIKAARGLQRLAGEDVFRAVWLKLLQDPREGFVLNVLHSTQDTSWAPIILEMLQRRPELAVRQSALCCLGSLKAPSAFPTAVKYLSDKDLKGYAVIALTSLGDPRAIPHLEPFLKDKTALWPVDNHGPMELMSEFVADAIQRLQPKSTESAMPSALSAREEPFQPPPPPVRKVRWLAYAPLASVLATALFFIFMVISVLEKRGQSGATAETQRLVDLAITFPGALGIILGGLALVRFGRMSVLERIACILGMLFCVPITQSFVTTLLR